MEYGIIGRIINSTTTSAAQNRQQST